MNQAPDYRKWVFGRMTMVVEHDILAYNITYILVQKLSVSKEIWRFLVQEQELKNKQLQNNNF